MAVLFTLVVMTFMSTEAAADGIVAPGLTADAYQIVTGHLPTAGELRDPLMQEAVTAVGEVGVPANARVPNDAYNVVMSIPPSPTTHRVLPVPPVAARATEFTDTTTPVLSVMHSNGMPDVPPAKTRAASEHDPFDDLFDIISHKSAQDITAAEYQTDKSLWLEGAPSPRAKVQATTLAASAPPAVTTPAAPTIATPVPKVPLATEHKKENSVTMDDEAEAKLKASLQNEIVAPFQTVAPAATEKIPHSSAPSNTSTTDKWRGAHMTTWDTDDAKIEELKENLQHESEKEETEVASAKKEVDAAEAALHEKIQADREAETTMQNDLEQKQHEFSEYQTKLEFQQKKLVTETEADITKLREDAKQKKEEHKRKLIEEKEHALQQKMSADEKEAQAAQDALKQALAKKSDDAKEMAKVKDEKSHVVVSDSPPVDINDDLAHDDVSTDAETLPPPAETPPLPVSSQCKTSAAQKCYKTCQHCIHCSATPLARTLCEDCHTKCGPCHKYVHCIKEIETSIKASQKPAAKVKEDAGTAHFSGSKKGPWWVHGEKALDAVLKGQKASDAKQVPHPKAAGTTHPTAASTTQQSHAKVAAASDKAAAATTAANEANAAKKAADATVKAAAEKVAEAKKDGDTTALKHATAVAKQALKDAKKAGAQKTSANDAATKATKDVVKVKVEEARAAKHTAKKAAKEAAHTKDAAREALSKAQNARDSAAIADAKKVVEKAGEAKQEADEKAAAAEKKAEQQTKRIKARAAAEAKRKKEEEKADEQAAAAAADVQHQIEEGKNEDEAANQRAEASAARKKEDETVKAKYDKHQSEQREAAAQQEKELAQQDKKLAEADKAEAEATQHQIKSGMLMAANSAKIPSDVSAIMRRLSRNAKMARIREEDRERRVKSAKEQTSPVDTARSMMEDSVDEITDRESPEDSKDDQQDDLAAMMTQMLPLTKEEKEQEARQEEDTMDVFIQEVERHKAHQSFSELFKAAIKKHMKEHLAKLANEPTSKRLAGKKALRHTVKTVVLKEAARVARPSVQVQAGVAVKTKYDAGADQAAAKSARDFEATTKEARAEAGISGDNTASTTTATAAPSPPGTAKIIEPIEPTVKLSPAHIGITVAERAAKKTKADGSISEVKTKAKVKAERDIKAKGKADAAAAKGKELKKKISAKKEHFAEIAEKKREAAVAKKKHVARELKKQLDVKKEHIFEVAKKKREAAVAKEKVRELKKQDAEKAKEKQEKAKEKEETTKRHKAAAKALAKHVASEKTKKRNEEKEKSEAERLDKAEEKAEAARKAKTEDDKKAAAKANEAARLAKDEATSNKVAKLKAKARQARKEARAAASQVSATTKDDAHVIDPNTTLDTKTLEERTAAGLKAAASSDAVHAPAASDEAHAEVDALSAQRSARKVHADEAKAKREKTLHTNIADPVADLLDQKILQDLLKNADEAKEDDKIEKKLNALIPNANGRMVTLEEMQQLKEQARKAEAQKAAKQAKQGQHLKVTEYTDRHGYILSDVELARKRMRESLQHAADVEEEMSPRKPRSVQELIHDNLKAVSPSTEDKSDIDDDEEEVMAEEREDQGDGDVILADPDDYADVLEEDSYE